MKSKKPSENGAFLAGNSLSSFPSRITRLFRSSMKNQTAMIKNYGLHQPLASLGSPLSALSSLRACLMATIFLAINLMFTMNLSAQITQVGTAQTATGTATVTINKPAGVAVGDVLIATLSYNEDSGNIDLDVPPVGPAGWVLIQDVNLDNGNGDDEWRGAVFYKIADASDVVATNYLFDLDDQTDGVVGGIIAFTGVHPTTPFDVAPGTINVTNSSTITATSITTVTPNAAIVMLAMVSDNNTISGWTTTSPGGLTELFDAGTAGGGDSQVGAAWAIKAAAGPTGNGTATMGATDENGGILLALRGCTPPSVDPIADGATEVCTGNDTPAFTNATAGGVWSIINGTGTATIAQTGIVTGGNAGTVTVVYTVTDMEGCQASATVGLVVGVPPQPSPIDGPTYVCANSTGHIYSVIDVPGTTYTWSISPGGAGWNIASGQGTNSITLDGGNNFPQTLSVTPSNPCGNGTPRTLMLTDNIVFCTSCTTCSEPIGDNPDLTGECADLKIAFVLDESGSVDGFEQEVENGVMAFVSALACTGVQLAVIEFNSSARFVLNGYNVVDNALVTAMQNYFDNVNNPLLVNNADYSPSTFTNYQAALMAVDALAETPDLILFVTDGVPTAVYLTNPPPAYTTAGSTSCGGTGTPQAAEIYNPAKIANKLKCEGAHMFVLGIGDAQNEIPTLQAISGTTAHSMVNTIATSDYATDDFAGLATCLAMFVGELCPFNSDATGQDICPNGGGEGSITIDVPAELLPYNYQYFNNTTNVLLGGAMNVNVTPLVINGLGAGEYRVEIQVTLPGSGCTRTETFFLEISPDAEEVEGSVVVDTQPTCEDLENGSATLTVTVGTPSFTITLQKGGVNEPGYPVVQAGVMHTATGLDFGSYRFLLQDANMCNIDTLPFTILEPMNCCEPDCPDDVTIDCGDSTDPVDTGEPLNTTGCGMVTFSDETASGVCPVVLVITRTWTSSTVGFICEQTITVQDTTNPVITFCPPDITIECTVSPIPANTGGSATATDVCDSSPSITYNDVTTASMTCTQEYTIARTWLATDDCGKVSSCTQMITVDDSVPPSLTCPPNMTIECTASTLPENTGTATATDLCDASPTVTYNDVTMASGNCDQEYTIIRTWTATDDCGNGTNCTQMITIDDSAPPSLTCPPNMTIECTESTLPANTGMATATDLCDLTPTVTYNDVTMALGNCSQEYTIIRTWTATDDCGNGTNCTQMITVDDSTPPALVCPANMTIECTASTLPDNTGTATASDLCDATPTVTYNDVTMASGNCDQEYTIMRTWTATDDCGNGTSCTQMITVDDSTPPVCLTQDITISEVVDPVSGVINLTADMVDNGSFDNCGGEVMLSVSPSSIPCSLSGPNIVVLTVTDECGNSSTCTATVTINCVDPCVTINTWVYLEGAATHPNGQPTYTIPMRTTLNNLRVLPGQTLVDPFFGPKYSIPVGQPYGIAPWNYMGTEGDLYDSNGNPMMGDAGYPATVVDYVLISLRADSAGTGGPVCQAAAFVHNDGRVEFIEDFDCCELDFESTYYLVIEHRNHLLVMSHVPLAIDINNSTITYDFRNQNSYIDDPFFLGIFSGQKLILPGVYAMYSSNGDQSSTANSDTGINVDDQISWQIQNGQLGVYRIGDYNLNSDVNFSDRVTWERNNDIITSVPRD